MKTHSIMKSLFLLMFWGVCFALSAVTNVDTVRTLHQDTVCLGATIRLTPDSSEVTDWYVWDNGANDGFYDYTAAAIGKDTLVCTSVRSGNGEVGNLLTEGGFEFPPSNPVHQEVNEEGDMISYAYMNFSTSGRDIGYGCTTTATNANNVKPQYFSHLQPHSGNYLLVCDGGNNSNAQVWTARDLKLRAGETYEFSCWVANIDLEYQAHGVSSLPKLKFVIENAVDGRFDLLSFTAPEELGVWEEHKAYYTPSQNLSWCHIYVVNYTTSEEGNDFALDDIRFKSMRKSIPEKVFVDTFALTIKDCSENLFDTICLGETYSRYGIEVTPDQTGDYEYETTDGLLLLTVLPIPEVVLNETQYKICNTSVVELSCDVTGEAPSFYSVQFNREQIAPIEHKSWENSVISLTLPDDLEPGTILATLILENENGCKKELDFKIIVATDDMIYAKWNDVIFCSNAEDKYVSYQWYCNGEPLPNETKQFYYNPTQDETGLAGASYSVCAKTHEGDEICSCEIDYNQIPRSADTYGSTSFRIKVEHGNVVVSQAKNEIMHIRIYSLDGLLLRELETNNQTAKVDALSKGIYVISIHTLSDIQRTEKIVVY